LNGLAFVIAVTAVREKPVERDNTLPLLLADFLNREVAVVDRVPND
jgi:hypothetical protein